MNEYHNVLMQGPPGAGKTLLARRLTSILPRLTNSEALEATRSYPVAGMIPSRGGSGSSCRQRQRPALCSE